MSVSLLCLFFPLSLFSTPSRWSLFNRLIESLVTLICLSVPTASTSCSYSHSSWVSLCFYCLSLLQLCFFLPSQFFFFSHFFQFLYFSAVFLSPFFLLLILSPSPASLPCLYFPLLPLSLPFSIVEQTAEAAKLPEARADRGAALSNLPPSPERQTNADTPISCKETIIHHLYQLHVFWS